MALQAAAAVLCQLKSMRLGKYAQSTYFFRDFTTFSALPANPNTKSSSCNFFHCDPGSKEVPTLLIPLSASLSSLPTFQTINPDYRNTISAALCQRNAQAICILLSAGLNRTAYTIIISVDFCTQVYDYSQNATPFFG
jgi:hypothetical protein